MSIFRVIVVTLLLLSATLTSAQGEEASLDRYFYTYHNPAGDHLLRGGGTFPDVATVDVKLRVWLPHSASENAQS